MFPFGLWLTLIFSIQPGDIREVFHYNSLFSFLQGIRVAFPLCVGALALIIIGFKLRRSWPQKKLFFGPLGLMVVYGAVGIIASINSPDLSTALYWAAAYLSVPAALWVIVCGPNSLRSISNIVNLNWLIILLVTGVLFTFGVVKLDFGDFLLSPGSWVDCGQQTWFIKSSSYIRATGVGRYAALAAIIALSRIWQPQWRSLWTVIFVAALLLLLYSGARTSLVGFGVAAPLVVLLTGGKKTALSSIAVMIVLTPVALVTGIHQDFYSNCISRSARYEFIPVDSARPLSIQSIQPELSGQTNEAAVSMTGVPTPGQFIPELSGQTNEAAVSMTGVPTPGLFTNRTDVWRQGIKILGESPILGYGFHADRLILKAHVHNSLVHALVQTGLLGTIPYVAALLIGWFLLLNLVRKINQTLEASKTLIIQTAGILTFLTIRMIPESTGAFFSVDWLILAPLLLYLQVANSASHEESGPKGGGP